MPRTPLIGAFAPSTPALFAGVPLLNGRICDDALVWSRSLVPGTPCLEEMQAYFQDEACVAWTRGLNVAAYWLLTGKVAGPAGERVFVESLEAAYALAAGYAGTPADAIDNWWWEASHRVLVYLVEAGRMESAAPFADVAAFYAQTAQDGGPEHLLAYGATLMSDLDLVPVRRGEQIGFRERAMAKARRVLGLPNGSHAEQTDDGRAGQARIPAKATSAAEMIETARTEAGPSLEVLATTDHLPGTAKAGEDRIGGSNVTGASSARSEYAPFAGRRWPLVCVPDLARAREALVAEFPYAADIVDAVLRDLVGRPHVHLRPIMIVGPPGSGKTRLARRLAEVLGLGWQILSCGGVSDSSLNGTSRQWGTGRACVPLQLLKRLRMACAVIVLDEIEKAALGKQNGSMLDGLLTLTADPQHFFDPYVEHPVDLSGISWIATANDLAGLRKEHGALVDRFRTFAMPSPRREDLPVLVRGIMAEIRAERGLDEHWLPDLDGDEEALIEQHFDGGSVRKVRRLCETIVAGREALATRM